MTDSEIRRRTGMAGAVERMVTAWALVGGLVLIAVVAFNVLEVLTAMTRPLTGYRFNGAVELTAMGSAIAAFCFLPYCQLTDANVTADIFTARASPRAIAIFKLAASIVAIAFALLLLWRMSEGMTDQRAYGYTTTVRNIPVWWAFVPIVISLALLALASIVTLIEQGRAAVTGADTA